MTCSSCRSTCWEWKKVHGGGTLSLTHEVPQQSETTLSDGIMSTWTKISEQCFSTLLNLNKSRTETKKGGEPGSSILYILKCIFALLILDLRIIFLNRGQKAVKTGKSGDSGQGKTHHGSELNLDHCISALQPIVACKSQRWFFTFKVNFLHLNELLIGTTAGPG